MVLHEKEDDIWASDCSDTEYERQIAEREWSRLNENFGNEGYKEGLSEGKDQTIENCFGEGFTEGGSYGLRMGELRGWLSSLLVSADALKLDQNIKEELRKLEEELRWYKSDKMFSTQYFRLNNTKTVSEKPESSDCCKEGDSSCCQNNENTGCSSELENNRNTDKSSQNSSSNTLEVLPDNMPYADKFQDKLPAEIVREYEEKVTKFINSLGLDITL